MSSYLLNRWTLVSVGIVIGFAYYYNRNSNTNSSGGPLREHILFGDMRRSAVVIGATGATGTSLVQQLLKSKEWGKVTIIHRRELDVSNMELTNEQSAKLRQYTVDMQQLLTDDNVQLFRDHDVTFCTLGTTRANAGSASNWRKVDVGMVRDSALASKQAEIKQFSLLTSSGANANVWANDWKIFHPLLYMKSKGEIENEVMRMGFARTSIFRPGLLQRGKFARSEEKMFSSFLRGTPVQDVAKAMIYDAESTVIDAETAEPAVFYEVNDIQAVAKL